MSVALAALSACGGEPPLVASEEPVSRVAATPPPAVPAPAPPATKAIRRSTPRPQSAAAPLPAPAESPASAPTPAEQLAANPPPPPADLRVEGLSRGDTRALLGAPDWEGDRAPAKIWRYQGPACSVEIYFFMDVGKGDFYVLKTAPAREAASRCLTEIAGQRKLKS